MGKRERLRRRRSDFALPDERSRASVAVLAHCGDCDKKAFAKHDARKLIRISGQKGMREYRCPAHPEQDWWHIGHLFAKTRQGTASVKRMRRERRWRKDPGGRWRKDSA